MVIENSAGGGISKAKNLRESLKALAGVSGELGWAVNTKTSSVGGRGGGRGLWIFSGTTEKALNNISIKQMKIQIRISPSQQAPKMNKK